MALNKLKYHSRTIRVWFWVLVVLGILFCINGITLLALGSTSYYYDYYDEEYYYGDTSFYAGGGATLVIGVVSIIVACVLYKRRFATQQIQTSYEHSQTLIPMSMYGKVVDSTAGPTQNTPARVDFQNSPIVIRLPQANEDTRQVFQTYATSREDTTTAPALQTHTYQNDLDHGAAQETVSAARFCASCGAHATGQFCTNCGNRCTQLS